MLSFEDVKNDLTIKSYITHADDTLAAMGYTEHSFAHVLKVASTAKYILETLDYSPQEQELVQIAGYLHDIGNLVNREGHAHHGAVLAFQLLTAMGAQPEEIASVVTAIGNHDEGTAQAVTPLAAALILADKTDVRRSRVRSVDVARFDIHDRVNYSVKKATTKINDEKSAVNLFLTIDTDQFSAMDYFEIFLNRMLLCRQAAKKLELEFHIYVNGQLLA